jgi:hypothetical protein
VLPPGQTHFEAWHTWVAPHAVLQPPHAEGSAVTSTQRLPQPVYGAEQAETHAPAWQKGEAPLHAAPHAPQFWGSLPTSVQVPPHESDEAGQAHLPSLHDWPAGHAVPQAPQFFGSFVVSTHPASHFVRPRAHAGRQAPFAQTSPGSHAWPQEPQLFGSIARSKHSVPHADCPAAQVGGGGGMQSPVVVLHVSGAPQSEFEVHCTLLPPQLPTRSAARTTRAAARRARGPWSRVRREGWCIANKLR